MLQKLTKEQAEKKHAEMRKMCGCHRYGSPAARHRRRTAPGNGAELIRVYGDLVSSTACEPRDLILGFESLEVRLRPARSSAPRRESTDLERVMKERLLALDLDRISGEQAWLRPRKTLHRWVGQAARPRNRLGQLAGESKDDAGDRDLAICRAHDRVEENGS